MVADTQVHGTTHEVPRERFAREQLTPLAGPLGARRVYARERVQHGPWHGLPGGDRREPLFGARALRGGVGRDPRAPGELRDPASGHRDRAPPLGRAPPGSAWSRRITPGLLRPRGVGTAGDRRGMIPATWPPGDVMVRDLGISAAIAEATEVAQ